MKYLYSRLRLLDVPRVVFSGSFALTQWGFTLWKKLENLVLKGPRRNDSNVSSSPKNFKWERVSGVKAN